MAPFWNAQKVGESAQPEVGSGAGPLSVELFGMPLTRLLRVLFILPCFGTMASAQSASTHIVRGTVFDSVRGAPLAGAIVQAVLADTTPGRIAIDPRAKPFVAISDGEGHFELKGLPSGKFLLAFQHDALDALGIESPVRLANLERDTIVAFNLAIPSPLTVRNLVCAAAGDTTAETMLAGYIVDAGGAPLTGGKVDLQWNELEVKGRRVRPVHRELTAMASESGQYHTCGVPADARVALRVSARDARPLESALSLPAGAFRRDFRLAGVRDTLGISTITMYVVDQMNRPVVSGEASIAPLGRETPIINGKAVISSLPSVTLPVVLRAIGYEPQLILLDAAGGDSSTTIVLTEAPQPLDTVNVKARLTRGDTSVLREIEKRMLTVGGTLIRRDNPSLLSAVNASDAIRVAAGFSLKSETVVEARPYVDDKGRLHACRSVASGTPSLRSNTLGGRSVVIYVDGTRFLGGLETVNRAVPPNQILAIETYSDVISAPIIWRTMDACAVIAFWTKH
jgi:hypothetical protein